MTLYEFLAGECNGQKETLDGRDEVGCGSCFQQYTCGANTNRFTCLPIERICDGEKNCQDGSDEVNCCQWTNWGAWQERVVYNSDEVTKVRYRDCGRTTTIDGELVPDGNCRCPGEKDYIQEWMTSSLTQAESGGLTWEQIDQNSLNGGPSNSTESQSLQEPQKPKLSTLSIIGIAAGILAALILIIISLTCYRKKKRKVLKAKTLTRIQEEFRAESHSINPYSSYSGYTVSV
ncbi:Oidioi.mRNA.OKI2018_I69.chr2.g4358.t1.cds [Oikopleura dioica]|uniref:Oidioi.mRNA.OKI2018_I69.chr2.g4358.t1.cds n=1 Tax=Oikopleura dioica TaxID=34765 RepID=A0ABN7T3Q1_OIKDI|nr:Oidioi.mRNA.OKI2018_I69.chr2.g4358.t1.cds [Oikopleura dioica]